MRIFTVILAILLSSAALAEDLSVRFGKLDIAERVGPTTYRFSFAEEMDKVPLLTLKQGGIYGMEYSAPEDQRIYNSGKGHYSAKRQRNWRGLGFNQKRERSHSYGVQAAKLTKGQLWSHFYSVQR